MKKKSDIAAVIKLVDLMGADLQKAQTLLRDDDCGFSRRMYIRTAFSYIEASANFFTQLLLTGNLNDTDLTSEEAQCLSGLQLDIKDNGTIMKRPLRASFLSRLKLALRCHLRALSSKTDASFFFDAKGFSALRSTIKIRDRITHPKSASELSVTSRETIDASMACAWLTVSFMLPLTGRAIMGHAIEELASGSKNADTADKSPSEYNIVEKQVFRLFQAAPLAGFSGYKLQIELEKYIIEQS